MNVPILPADKAQLPFVFIRAYVQVNSTGGLLIVVVVAVRMDRITTGISRKCSSGFPSFSIYPGHGVSWIAEPATWMVTHEHCMAQQSGAGSIKYGNEHRIMMANEVCYWGWFLNQRKNIQFWFAFSQGFMKAVFSSSFVQSTWDAEQATV